MPFQSFSLSGAMHITGWLLLLCALLSHAGPVQAQLSSFSPVMGNAHPPQSSEKRPNVKSAESRSREAGTLVHVVGDETRLYNRSDSTAPVTTLPLRTPLQSLDCADTWCRVRTDSGRTGYVPATAVSNLWLRVSKADRRLYVYRGVRLVDVFKVDIGYNTFADKIRRGSRAQRDHWRTPEGSFYIVDKNPRSKFYKALVLNYPTTSDAERGLKEDLISRREYEAIVQAQKESRMPPMHTKLGGWIEIHGEGTGASTNWTQGCIAVENRVMNTLWREVDVGTPVLIE